MRALLPLLLLAASPALAQEAHPPFLSLRNTEFIVFLAFILFVAVLLYFKVPAMVAKMLDGRAETIRKELSEARSLRDEAQALLGSFDAKRAEMEAQSARIVEEARSGAQRAAQEARAEAERSVARRLASAEEQIASAEARALRDVRDRAVSLAVEAAREVLASQLTAADADRMIDDSIETVGRRLH